jgi:hypothetical protein
VPATSAAAAPEPAAEAIADTAALPASVVGPRHLDADPDSDFLFDADPDPYADLSSQIKAQPLETVLT